MLNWIKSRLMEPSTHAALAAVAAASIPLFGDYGMVATAVFAVLGFTVAEKKS